MCDRKFAGKVVIVTGSSSGIGQGVALLFGQQGANVTIHGLELDEVKETEKLMLEAGVSPERILLVAGDVRDPKTCENLISKTAQKWGKLDVLVNNAGCTRERLPSPTYIFRIVRLNKLAIPHLEKTKGNIVNTCSGSAMGRSPEVPTFYAMSKVALDHYVKYEASALAEKGIRMNNTAPGITVTKIKLRVGGTEEEYKEEVEELIEKGVPIGRPGLPKDMAHAVSFLASDEASYVCGTTLLIDGGLRLGRA
uniref:3-oxoacyl-[acyl-carrier-protein] reductase n=1 Tax=Steinernema glaseri TaxID=37863 RepID=A0A1I7YZK7_9BILA